MEFKDAFPKEYESLTGATVNDQVKKGYLLDANTVRRGRTGVADPAAPKRRPDGDKGSKFRSGHPRGEPADTPTSNPPNSKEVPV